ncbi:iron-containing alcohol dehydrogenase [Amycolatopsis rhabdoformis]|uniref:Iron-containing alcohol dehydrogenase n=1 Tax=Amycolatopsis rhabdoformis TaxID=1448059 RepID=A0ABZ1I6C8_9PSEU|nr:iron-containing alcohol dehydrogenase [Amycolatopsis rhabdoformis]WSE29938.1 iron-containing alcohol dehydrogenase [Amycolatopsis rhabdoformis]
MSGTTTDENENLPSPLLFAGGGSLEELPEIVDRLGARKALLVVGPGCAAPAERVRHLLGGRSTGSFTDTVAHVPSWEVNLAVASAQEVHADSVIAIGGGSSAGYAKIVALALGLPWIAVPTTLSGAEMTSRYFVTTGKGKESGRSRRCAARAVVRDPELLDLTPARVLASSGMAAVGACLEILAGTPSRASATAADAQRALREVLPLLVRDPADRELRVRALESAALAGAALEAAGPGPAQLIAEDLGATHRVDHGSLIACLAPHVGAGADLAGQVLPAETVRNFAGSLGLPVDLGSVCPPFDADALVERLAARPDLAGPAAVDSLRLVLKEAMR